MSSYIIKSSFWNYWSKKPATFLLSTVIMDVDENTNTFPIDEINKDSKKILDLCNNKPFKDAHDELNSIDKYKILFNSACFINTLLNNILYKSDWHDFINYFISKGLDLDNCKNIMFIAIKSNNYIEILKFLNSKKINIYKCNEQGENILYKCLYEDNWINKLNNLVEVFNFELNFLINNIICNFVNGKTKLTINFIQILLGITISDKNIDIKYNFSDVRFNSIISKKNKIKEFYEKIRINNLKIKHIMNNTMNDTIEENIKKDNDKLSKTKLNLLELLEEPIEIHILPLLSELDDKELDNYTLQELVKNQIKFNLDNNNNNNQIKFITNDRKDYIYKFGKSLSIQNLLEIINTKEIILNIISQELQKKLGALNNWCYLLIFMNNKTLDYFMNNNEISKKIIYFNMYNVKVKYPFPLFIILSIIIKRNIFDNLTQYSLEHYKKLFYYVLLKYYNNIELNIYNLILLITNNFNNTTVMIEMIDDLLSMKKINIFKLNDNNENILWNIKDESLIVYLIEKGVNVHNCNKDGKLYIDYLFETNIELCKKIFIKNHLIFINYMKRYHTFYCRKIEIDNIYKESNNILDKLINMKIKKVMKKKLEGKNMKKN